MRIRTPCQADWDTMIGDATVRFCRACQKNVTNVDALDEEAFRALVQSGKACVRGRAGRDGTLVRFLALAGATAAAVAGGGGSLAWSPPPPAPEAAMAVPEPAAAAGAAIDPALEEQLHWIGYVE
jgi:hypothetical protein